MADLSSNFPPCLQNSGEACNHYTRVVNDRSSGASMETDTGSVVGYPRRSGKREACNHYARVVNDHSSGASMETDTGSLVGYPRRSGKREACNHYTRVVNDYSSGASMETDTGSVVGYPGRSGKKDHNIEENVMCHAFQAETGDYNIVGTVLCCGKGEPCYLEHSNIEWKMVSCPIRETANESSSNAVMGSNMCNKEGHATKIGKSKANLSKWCTTRERNQGKSLVESSSRKSSQPADIRILILGDLGSGAEDLIYSFLRYHQADAQVGSTGRHIFYVQRKDGPSWLRLILIEINAREALEEGTLSVYRQAIGAVITVNFNESDPHVVQSVGDWVNYAETISDAMELQIIGTLSGSQQAGSGRGGRGGSQVGGHAGSGRAGSGRYGSGQVGRGGSQRAGTGRGGSQRAGIVDILRDLYPDIPVMSWEFHANTDPNDDCRGRSHWGLPDPITLFVDEIFRRRR